MSGERTYFYYTEDGLSGEFDAEGGLVRGYLYEPNRGWQTRPLAMKVPSGAFYYYITDHLGTPQALINKNMQVGWSGKYGAFGELSAVVNTVENPLRFPGQYYDEETGLHQNYMREYDPRLGAYTSQDPVGAFVTGANRYGYVGGNPVLRTDPTGEFAIVIVLPEIIDAIIIAAIYPYAKNIIDIIVKEIRKDWDDRTRAPKAECATKESTCSPEREAELLLLVHSNFLPC